jgi:hypothetical protein
VLLSTAQDWPGDCVEVEYTSRRKVLLRRTLHGRGGGSVRVKSCHCVWVDSRPFRGGDSESLGSAVGSLKRTDYYCATHTTSRIAGLLPSLFRLFTSRAVE